MSRRDYDLVVIGGGAAGLGAVRAGARAGARTLLVSQGEPGGECTFTGCVPSKTLIEAAAQGLPYADAVKRIRAVVAEVAATENADALHGEGVDVLFGWGRFLDPRRIIVDGRTIGARRFVIATGSRPAVPRIPGLRQVPYLTNETVFDLPHPPTSLAVLGGGAVGCELAQAFARLASQVTVIEPTDRLLPGADPDASTVISAVFAREGIRVRTAAQVEAVTTEPGRVRLWVDGGPDVIAERVLVAVGRIPITDDLGLSAVGVRTDDDGFIVTGDTLATTAPGVFAAGDVTGRLLFTHAAFEMGRVAAHNALRRRRRPYRTDATPTVVFTDPEVAQVGLTEKEATGRPGARVAYLPMSEMDRALTADATDGFIKLIAGHRRMLRGVGGGRILGATIVATRAGELIHEPALAMAIDMFTSRLAAATHAYPTWSYGIQLTAAQFFMPIGGRSYGIRHGSRE